MTTYKASYSTWSIYEGYTGKVLATFTNTPTVCNCLPWDLHETTSAAGLTTGRVLGRGDLLILLSLCYFEPRLGRANTVETNSAKLRRYMTLEPSKKSRMSKIVPISPRTLPSADSVVSPSSWRRPRKSFSQIFPTVSPGLTRLLSSQFWA